MSERNKISILLRLMVVFGVFVGQYDGEYWKYSENPRRADKWGIFGPAWPAGGWGDRPPGWAGVVPGLGVILGWWCDLGPVHGLCRVPVLRMIGYPRGGGKTGGGSRERGDIYDTSTISPPENRKMLPQNQKIAKRKIYMLDIYKS